MIRTRPPYHSPKRATAGRGGSYSEYYNSQFGRGGGFYSGRVFQSGHGLGGALLGLMRSATPLLKTVGKNLLRAGVGVANDLMAGGTSFQKSVKNRGLDALKRVTGDLMTDGKKKSRAQAAGRVTKRRRTSPQQGSGRRKRHKSDIFDL